MCLFLLIDADIYILHCLAVMYVTCYKWAYKTGDTVWLFNRFSPSSTEGKKSGSNLTSVIVLLQFCFGLSEDMQCLYVFT